MKLLVALEKHFVSYRGGVYSNNLTYEGFWQRYKSVFEEVLIVGRMRELDSPPFGLSRASGPGVQFQPLPEFQGPWQFLAVQGKVKASIRQAIDKCDAFMLRVPGTIGTIVWKQLRKRGLPFGVEVVGNPWDSFSPGSVRSIVRPYARWSFTRNQQKQCQEAATSSYVTAEALQRRYPPNINSYTTHYSSIELPDDMVLRDVSDRLDRVADVPKRLNGDREPVRIGFIGSFSQMYKAPDIHIQAIAKCVENGGNVIMEMAGDGNHLEEMKALAAQLGLKDRIKFIGRLSSGQAIFNFLDKMDLFLNASRQEGLPRVLIEAMSRGCPSIGTDLAGILEMLEPTHLVPVNDSDILAERIMEVLKDGDGLVAAAKRNVDIARRYMKSVLDKKRTEHYTQLRWISEKI